MRRGGGLWDPENRKACRQLIISVQHLAVSHIYLCVFDSGAVSLAGAQNNLWAVEGGNKLVCSGLLRLANANLLKARVKSISPVQSGSLMFGD